MPHVANRNILLYVVSAEAEFRWYTMSVNNHFKRISTRRFQPFTAEYRSHFFFNGFLSHGRFVHYSVSTVFRLNEDTAVYYSTYWFVLLHIQYTLHIYLYVFR